MLSEFVETHRAEILRRGRARAIHRFDPAATAPELEAGVKHFLTQLQALLSLGDPPLHPDQAPIEESAAAHGADLYRSGCTIAQVVNVYGDLCQSLTELAEELGEPISVSEFHAFNWCVDYATAVAVTGFQRVRDLGTAHDEVERLEALALDLRSALSVAQASFTLIRRGTVGVGGSTSNALERSLARLGDLIGRSLTEIRLSSGVRPPAAMRLADLIHDIEVDATAAADSRSMTISVARVDANLMVQADHQLLFTAVSNLVQNAFQFTPAHGHVGITTDSTGDRVRIRIADECGGLPAGKIEELFAPLAQHGSGLGLDISRRAAEAMGASVSAENLPSGCVFSVEVPRAPLASAPNAPSRS